MRDVDVAVIGAGTSGLAAYRAAVRHGKKAVLVEAGAHGTTCARVGCMPSKLLIAAADAVHHAKSAGPFGVHATVQIDGRAVMDRVRRERDRFVGFVLEGVDAIPASDRMAGWARFVNPHELEVGGERVRARTIVIATGSSPWVPSIFDAVPHVVNDDVFAWEELPERVNVFGAGVIGLEIGQALHRLGVRVRIFGKRGAVGPLRDPVVKNAAARVFRDELDVDFDSASTELPRDGVILVAAGRRPNLEGLRLESAGVAPGFTVNPSTLQIDDSHIFIAGDAHDHLPLLHEAADEGTIAGENAARFPDVKTGRRRTPLAIAFTDPGLAVIGGGYPGEREHVTGEVDFGNQGRSRIMLQDKGIARLYADPDTRRFLGAEIAGPRAEHLAHLLAWAHQAELTVDQMLAMPFYHPVVEEGLRTALRDLASNLPVRPAPSAGRPVASLTSARLAASLERSRK
jgi:dihydrolipoamide dehydrogenase